MTRHQRIGQMVFLPMIKVAVRYSEVIDNDYDRSRMELKDDRLNMMLSDRVKDIRETRERRQIFNSDYSDDNEMHFEEFDEYEDEDDDSDKRGDNGFGSTGV